MPKIKYDVSKIEDVADRAPAPVGLYRASVVKCEPKQSKNGNAMLEVQLHLTHSGDGKKLKEEFGDVWTYPIMDHDHPYVQAQWKEFISSMGLKPKGDLDTDKIVGKKVQVKLKSDTDQDGEYRPRVGKLMALAAEAANDEPEDEDIPEGAEDEADEEEAEDDDEEGIDLAELDRNELKALIKEEGLEIKVLKKHTDDDIRSAIAEAMGVEDEDEEEEEDEEEPEAEDQEDEAEDDGYDSMSVAELKAELAERELPTSGARKILVGRLRKDDGSDSF